jgi:hypothetical protein
MKWDIKSISYGNAEMDDFVLLRLPRQFVNEMIEGLAKQIGMFKSTADYLESGVVPDDGLIADTSNEHEAVLQAEYYQTVLDCMRSQL